MPRKGVVMKESQFQFTDPKLEEVKFIVNETFDNEKFQGISLESNTTVRDLESRKSYVALTLYVGGEDENQPFNIMVRMSAIFTWSEYIEDDRVKLLLRTNAPAALLSYIRPLVTIMTASSGYPSLNIPFINFTENEIHD